MHDPKFEKEVQQRMEELEFTPSEAVWVNLHRGLHKEKRRRAPMLWLFFLLGGMMLGAGGASLFYFSRPSSPRLSSMSGIGAAGSPATGKTTVVTVSPVAPATAKNVEPKNGIVTGSPVASARGKNIMPKNVIVTGSAAAEKRAMATGSSATGKKTIATGSPATVRTMVEGGRGNTGAQQREGNRSIVTGVPGQLHPTADRDIASSLGRIRLSSAMAGLNVRDLNSSAKKQPLTARAAMADKHAAKKARFSNTPSWEAGFAAGGGLSSAALSQTPAVHAQTSYLTSPTLSLASSLQLSASGAGRPQLRFSRIRPDVSFWAGIFVQRPVLKRLSLTLGLNLHYYSTRLETGQQAPDSVNTNRASLFYPTTAYAYAPRAAQGAPYTSENYKYSNHYYFLEIPISLQWQFNRSRKTPLFWEGGLSYSRLVSANALYYNEKSGMYYKDGGAASPNHLLAFSSVMVGLSWRGNLIRLGPEGQYGLSSLVNTNNASGQHLCYGGLKVIVIPRKW